jgi:NhaA family Na+:H+ antiporter
MRLTGLFKEFFDSEKAGGFILIFCTILSLIIANSVWANSYMGFWHTDIFGHHLTHWINDGLMVIFFLLIGLELERELFIGELSYIKNALFPVFAAIGGMLVPAGIFMLFNFGTEYQSGAGIPMATDIAFAIGILAILGKRVPAALKVFLVALAVIDDLGAILTIAIFYSKGLSLLNLGLALGIFVILLGLKKYKVYNLIPYIIGGIVMWYFMLNSGVHATITGVLLAFAIPFTDGSKRSPSYKLQHFLHKPVSFLILPLFALANTAIIINSNWMDSLSSTMSIGIFAGLVFGKPLGITLFAVLAVLLKLTKKPGEILWKDIVGVGFLAGIGFTMSIFISILAYDNDYIIDSSKIAILLSSLIAAIIGLVWLRLSLKEKSFDE